MLEELLISADVGVSTAEKLVGRVKQQVREADISDGAEVQAVLKQEMVSILEFDAEVEPPVTTGPCM